MLRYLKILKETVEKIDWNEAFDLLSNFNYHYVVSKNPMGSEKND